MKRLYKIKALAIREIERCETFSQLYGTLDEIREEVIIELKKR